MKKCFIILAAIIAAAPVFAGNVQEGDSLSADSSRVSSALTVKKSCHKSGTRTKKTGRKTGGKASWYSYRGGMYTASTVYPKGTILKVVNKDNGRSVKVRVNDYGPEKGTRRVLDLDKVAFKRLAPLVKGVIDIYVEVFHES